MENRQCEKSNGASVVMNIQNGDVVRLAGSVTLAEFGLALCDNGGEILEIDGVVMKVLPQWVDVRIKRMLKTVSFAAPMEGAFGGWCGVRKCWRY